MSVLMVGPYAPARDGIAAYTLQAVAKLRSEGNDVEVLSPWPSAAHHHLDLKGWRGPLALARRARSYERVVLQFHPDLIYPQPFDDRRWAAASLAMEVFFRRAPNLEVRVHETDYSRGGGTDLLARAVRRMWQAAPSVVVHTGTERDAFHQAFGVPLARIHVTDHGADFIRHTSASRDEARASLGIPLDEFQFLSIGFIQPHKGFDRALRAFATLDRPRTRLDIVGSVRVDEPACLRHLAQLKDLTAATPGATVHDRYVSDEEFDRWLVGADVVVLPYRHIWSSGVVERAALYGRPVIVTAVGGLESQARSRPGTTVVDGDDQLADAMRVACGMEPLGPPQWRLETPVEREAIMIEIRSRAEAQRLPGMPEPRRASVLPLRRLGRFLPPPATSARPGASAAKRVLRRLTAWQLDPLVRHLNLVHEVSARTSEQLEARLEGRPPPEPATLVDELDGLRGLDGRDGSLDGTQRRER